MQDSRAKTSDQLHPHANQALLARTLSKLLRVFARRIERAVGPSATAPGPPHQGHCARAATPGNTTPGPPRPETPHQGCRPGHVSRDRQDGLLLRVEGEQNPDGDAPQPGWGALASCRDGVSLSSDLREDA